VEKHDAKCRGSVLLYNCAMTFGAVLSQILPPGPNVKNFKRRLNCKKNALGNVSGGNPSIPGLWSSYASSSPLVRASLSCGVAIVETLSALGSPWRGVTAVCCGVMWAAKAAFRPAPLLRRCRNKNLIFHASDGANIRVLECVISLRLVHGHDSV
jgi:hypothetical protein